MRRVKWKMLFVCILIPEVIGFISGWVTRSGLKEFDSLKKPLLTPPKVVFPLVWIILFLLMGIASYLVLNSHHSQKKTAMKLYGVQLILNFFWSIIFFNLQQHLVALLWLGLLMILVLATTYFFYRCQKSAGWLLVPYMIWLMLAVYLNYGVYVLNG